ncbi:hypothetical protein Tco_0911023, partial [Tanacetum coccineum]
MSSSALDTNPSQPPASTYVDVGMHKEDQQAAGGPTSLGVTSEEGSHPQLSSGMSASNLNQPIFLASFIIYSEFALGRDASIDSTAEADSRESAPHDFIPQQKKQNQIYLSKLVQNVSADFMDQDSPKDDHIIVVNESEVDEEDKDEGIHADSNFENNDTLVPKPLSP